MLLTELQTWIFDNHWCNWNLPAATSSFFGFSARLKDQGVADWSNFYDRRRESMWIDQSV